MLVKTKFAKAGLSKACKKALLAMIDEIHSQSTLFSKKFYNFVSTAINL